MSILGAETTLYPEMLLDPAGPRTADRQWMAVYTKARQEKALARDLLRQEIPFYLPVVKRTSLYRGRRRARYLPLFSGYLFLYGSEAERIASLATNHISRVLVVPDAEELVRELRNLRQLIEAEGPADGREPLGAGPPGAGAAGAVCRHRGDGAGPPRRDAAAGEHQFSPAGRSRSRSTTFSSSRSIERSAFRPLRAGLSRFLCQPKGTVPSVLLSAAAA